MFDSRTIEITNKDNELEVIFNDQFSTLTIETTCPDDDWSNKLIELKINKQKDEYYLPRADGTQWELDHKVESQPTTHIDGSNDCPQNSMTLIDPVEELSFYQLSFA